MGLEVEDPTLPAKNRDCLTINDSDTRVEYFISEGTRSTDPGPGLQIPSTEGAELSDPVSSLPIPSSEESSAPEVGYSGCGAGNCIPEVIGSGIQTTLLEVKLGWQPTSLSLRRLRERWAHLMLTDMQQLEAEAVELRATSVGTPPDREYGDYYTRKLVA